MDEKNRGEASKTSAAIFWGRFFRVLKYVLLFLFVLILLEIDILCYTFAIKSITIWK